MSECTPMMTRFRRRLLQLIRERCEGKYTCLARRAGIPVSSMEHTIHSAKHVPGGEQLIRLAQALGVSVDYLATGEATVRPADLLAHPVILTDGRTPPFGHATDIAIPVFRCGCPNACPLTEPVPPVAAAQSTVIFPVDMVGGYEHHRLIAIQVGQGLDSAEWPEGARLVVDWDARTPRWVLPLIPVRNATQARITFSQFLSSSYAVANGKKLTGTKTREALFAKEGDAASLSPAWFPDGTRCGRWDEQDSMP